MDEQHKASASAHSGDGAKAQHAFLLRLWHADWTWQASLQDVKSGQRIGFASLEELFAYLMETAEKDTPAQST